MASRFSKKTLQRERSSRTARFKATHRNRETTGQRRQSHGWLVSYLYSELTSASRNREEIAEIRNDQRQSIRLGEDPHTLNVPAPFDRQYSIRFGAFCFGIQCRERVAR